MGPPGRGRGSGETGQNWPRREAGLRVEACERLSRSRENRAEAAACWHPGSHARPRLTMAQGALGDSSEPSPHTGTHLCTNTQDIYRSGLSTGLPGHYAHRAQQKAERPHLARCYLGADADLWVQ